MEKLLHRRPSASIVIALLALVLAASGTAVAASRLLSGDKLIKKRSLSGNRLKNHTITGKQVNLNKLGTVPSATNAAHASVADSAANAGNAGTLGGQAPSAFEPSSNFIRTGLVKAIPGQTVTLASFGPFVLSLKCSSPSKGKTAAEIDATSTEANSDGFGTAMTNGGQSYDVLDLPAHIGGSAGPAESNGWAADFLAPSGKTYMADLVVGENFLGLTDTCFANALISPS
jgi:hypothetical protein